MTEELTAEPVWHDAAWAARRLGRSEDWVRRSAQKGLLPHHKDGRYLRFTEGDIAEYLERTRVAPVEHMGRSRRSRRRRAA